jgi:Ca2+-binding RTX toxin-like protein
VSFTENAAGVVTTLAATDPEDKPLVWSLSGADANLFSIDADGAVRFKSTPDFETPLDLDRNNAYDLVVSVSDGTSTVSHTLSVSVADINEAPTGVVLNGATIQEDVANGGNVGSAHQSAGKIVGSLTALDPDAVGGHVFSLVGGAADKFEIVGSDIRVRTGVSFDFEAGANTHNLVVRVTDGSGAWAEQTVQINVVNFAGSAQGGAGNDVLIGSAEEDVLKGGAGDDVLKATPGETHGYVDFSTPSTGAAALKDGVIHFDKPVDGAIVTLSDPAGNNWQTVRATAYFKGVAVGFVTADLYGDNATLAVDLGDGVLFDEIVLESQTWDWTKGGNLLEPLSTTPYSIAGVRYGLDTPAAETNVLDGGDGNDRLYGSNGKDTLLGGAGDDILHGSAGADVLNGGAGFDVVDYAASTAPVRLILDTPDASGFNWNAKATPGVSGGHADGDTLTSIEGIVATDGDDSIYGASTGMTVWLGKGDDYYDTRSDSTGIDTIDGGAGEDRIFGGGGDDHLMGGDGDDTVSGEDGDDRVEGGAGNDSVWGGKGDDVLIGGTGFDRISGGDGRDVLYAESEDPQTTLQVLGKDGFASESKGVITFTAPVSAALFSLQDASTGTFQTVRATAYFKGVAVGSVSADLYGDNAAVAIDLGPVVMFDEVRIEAAVYDWSTGGYEYVSLSDTPFSLDTVRYDTGDEPSAWGDYLDGGAGDDVLYGGRGKDTLLGGDGDDVILGSAGADTIDGGSGFDTVDYSQSAAPITLVLNTPDKHGFEFNSGQPRGAWGGDAEGDKIVGVERIIATAGNDRIYGAAGGMTAELGAGDDYYDTRADDDGADFVRGGDGADLIFGGGGNDELYGDDGGDDLFGEAGDDRLYGGAGADSLFGGAGADMLFGGEGNDRLDGGDGDDILYGGDGVDYLDGGRGRDKLYGGDGDDYFVHSGRDTGSGDIAFGEDGSDTFLWQINSGDWSVSGGDGTWLDTLQLSRSDWSQKIDYQSHWTITFTQGGIESANKGELLLSANSAGTITIIATGEQIHFDSLEVIRWG